jgi:hypothetical protein
MIDNPAQMERLLAELEAALPLPAWPTPELVKLLQTQNPALEISPICSITSVSYVGDEGGIVCRLSLGEEAESPAAFASITHLRFDARLPLARDITAYQKHRVKRLRRQAP